MSQFDNDLEEFCDQYPDAAAAASLNQTGLLGSKSAHKPKWYAPVEREIDEVKY